MLTGFYQISIIFFSDQPKTPAPCTQVTNFVLELPTYTDIILRKFDPNYSEEAEYGFRIILFDEQTIHNSDSPRHSVPNF